VLLIVLQTAAEVLPFVASGIPWTQPQAMKYGGFVFIFAVALWFLWWLRLRRSSRSDR